MLLQMNSCSSVFSPKHPPLQHAPADCIKKLQSPVKQIHGVLHRNQDKKHYSIKCAQSLFCLTNRSSEDTTSNRNNKYRVPVTLQDGYASKSEDDNNSRGLLDILLKNINALYLFSRPYCMIGTIVGITSVSLLPLQTFADLTPKFFIGLLKALVPTILMFMYQNGINQIYDVEIDKINKPDLPLASGDISMGGGVAIISISLLTSLAMGIMFQSPPILSALCIIFLLSSIYSVDLPFLRWKKNSFLTAMSIVIGRGLVLQFPYFIHMQKYVLGRPLVITKPIIFASAIVSCISIVISLIKDLPDVDGDKEFGIQTITVRIGRERVFWLCVSMLLIAYGAAVLVGASSPFLLSKLVTIIGHCALASYLWLKAHTVDLSNNKSTYSFYMFIWKLYFFENLLIPFVR